MSVVLPQGTDVLSADNHARLHRCVASDSAAPDQSITINASGSAVLIQPLVFPDSTTQGTAAVSTPISTDAAMTAASDALVPSQRAVVFYVQANKGTGTVTNVGATSPLASSGGTTPVISFTGTLPIANGGTGTTALANNPNGIVKLDGSLKLPAVDGSLLTNLPLPSGVLGAPVARSGSTVYQAATDGIVEGYTGGSSNTNTCYFYCYTDSNSSPSVVVEFFQSLWVSGAPGQQFCFSFVVRKGNYYEVVAGAGVSVMTFTPLGI